MNKIFCVGLPKTGTTSLHHAAKILGLRSVHFPSDRRTVAQLRRGDYRLRVAEENDILSDVPIPVIFPQLDTAFPGARFIYTWRPLDAWLKSESTAPFNADPPKPGSTRDFYRAILYGVTEFSEERFRWVHQDHHRRVTSYFSGGRESDILVMDITAGDGWEKLCPFLGLPVPDAPFPKSNVAGDEPRSPLRALRGLLRRK